MHIQTSPVGFPAACSKPGKRSKLAQDEEKMHIQSKKNLQFLPPPRTERTYNLLRWKYSKAGQSKKKLGNVIENLYQETEAYYKKSVLPSVKEKISPFTYFLLKKQVMKMSDFTNAQLLQQHAHFSIYRGTKRVDNQSICIKIYTSIHDFVGVEGIIREITIATPMSKHKNSLKLLCCCLETEYPVIVYENPDQGCLADYTTSPKQNSLPWKIKFKIICEISSALAYLQNEVTSSPLIFRNLHSKDIFLDKDDVPKLSGYYYSVMIPESENHVNDAIVGTTGFGAPEYISSGRLTEKTDVYCFGVFLLELLVNSCRYQGLYFFRLLDKIRDHGKNVDIDRIVDPAILMEIKENGKQQQLKEIYELTSKCIASNENDRPTMVDVAGELKKCLDSI